jgi:tRNA U34 5-methylaminomethyl-2-thiouridine-forming methyltransferase MnmC
MEWRKLSSSTSDHYCLTYLGMDGSIHLHIHKHALIEEWSMTANGIIEVPEAKLGTTELAVAKRSALAKLRKLAGLLYIAVDSFEKDVNNVIEAQN